MTKTAPEAALESTKVPGGIRLVITPISMDYISLDRTPPLPMESTGTTLKGITIH